MIYLAVTMLIFAAMHSFLAGRDIKQAVQKRWGERAYHGLYRIVYNVIAVMTLTPALVLLLIEPGRVLWRLEGAAAVIALAVQFAGLVGLAVSLLQIDLGQFAGTSQLRAYLNGQALPLPTEPLQVKGVYAVVRHPLYLFSLLFIWPAPVMTEMLFVLNVAATLYFIFGSLLEEKRLIRIFGQQYIDYQRRVPWLIPFVRFL